MPSYKVYVASSWRNQEYPAIVETLRAKGFDVYDFRNPSPDDNGFSWREIDSNWQNWTVDEYRRALRHPASERGFGFDMKALSECDICVLVLPCGRSAHLELGYAVGAGKPTFVLLKEGQEPELMYKMCTHLCANLDELISRMMDHGAL